MWDEKKFGYIKLDDLIENMVALGLVQDPQLIAKELKGYSYTHAQLLSLFRNHDFVDKAIEVMNWEIRNKRKEEAQKAEYEALMK